MKKAANREAQRLSFSASHAGRRRGHGDIALRSLNGAGHICATGPEKGVAIPLDALCLHHSLAFVYLRGI
jgi:hypothetical protein